MNRTNVFHGEENRKIDLGNSPDFLIEKEVEGICRCYWNYSAATLENLEVITGRGQGKKDRTVDYCTQTRKVAYN